MWDIIFCNMVQVSYPSIRPVNDKLELSLEVVSCPRFDMVPSTIRSPSSQREDVKWLPVYVEKQDVEQTQKVIPLISRETSCDQNVSELFFDVNIFGWVPSWSCQTTSQEQLCGFLLHVSLLGFDP